MAGHDRTLVTEAALIEVGYCVNYKLYTDGACQPNPGVGGWAFLLRDNDGGQTKQSGYEEQTTNNRMELQSVLEGLKFFAESIWTGEEALTLFSDSKYVVNGINDWSKSWHKNGWKKKDNKPVLNADLWKKIYNLKTMLNMEAIHVYGHCGHEFNEIVDQLAVQASKESKRGKKRLL